MRLLVVSTRARAAIAVRGTGMHTSIQACTNRLRRITTFSTPSLASVAVSPRRFHVRDGVVHHAVVSGAPRGARWCKAAAATPVASSQEPQQPRHVLGLRPEVMSALVAVGAETPTSVQIAAAPVIVSGRDAWLACETGSGKTLAYLGPLFSLLRQQEVDATSTQGYLREPYRPRALIMAPTVELVEQIAAVAKSLSHHAKLRVLGLDAPQAYAARRLAAGVDLVVGTPGRVRTMRERGVLFLSRVEHVVLDEADTLLDESFAAETLAQACKPELATALRVVERRMDGVGGDAEWDAAPRSAPKGVTTSNRPPRKPTQLIAVGATLRRDSYEMLRRVLPDMVRNPGTSINYHRGGFNQQQQQQNHHRRHHHHIILVIHEHYLFHHRCHPHVTTVFITCLDLMFCHLTVRPPRFPFLTMPRAPQIAATAITAATGSNHCHQRIISHDKAPIPRTIRCSSRGQHQ